MGFFNDLKEDLSQAVNELPDGEAMDTQGSDSSFGAATNETAQPEESIPAFDAASAVEPEVTVVVPTVEAAVAEEEDDEILDETAVITMGMTVKGDISSKGSMDVIGTVEGNINVKGKLNVTGNITGDSSAAEIYMEKAKVDGAVQSAGCVKIGNGTVVIGNIFATSAVIAGAIKGDIDVHGPVILDSSAIVKGNIKSKSVQINNGAAIEGLCSQCYADVNPTAFFDEVK